jgi:hypothetical protein
MRAVPEVFRQRCRSCPRLHPCVCDPFAVELKDIRMSIPRFSFLVGIPRLATAPTTVQAVERTACGNKKQTFPCPLSDPTVYPWILYRPAAAKRRGLSIRPVFRVLWGSEFLLAGV